MPSIVKLLKVNGLSDVTANVCQILQKSSRPHEHLVCISLIWCTGNPGLRAEHNIKLLKFLRVIFWKCDGNIYHAQN